MLASAKSRRLAWRATSADMQSRITSMVGGGGSPSFRPSPQIMLQYQVRKK
jgi:hypothetical protein